MTKTIRDVLRAVACCLALLATLAAPLEASAGPAEQALITHYYQTLLRRAPDAGGLAYWDGEATRMRNAGQEPKEAFLAMAIQFIESAEYRAFNRTNAGYVTDMYQAFFAGEGLRGESLSDYAEALLRIASHGGDELGVADVL